MLSNQNRIRSTIENPDNNNLYGHVQKKVALEIDFFKCILKIVIALCWLLNLSRPLEIRCNYMMLKSQSIYCLYHMSYRY